MDKKYNIVSKELIIRSRSTSVDFALLKDNYHGEIQIILIMCGFQK